MEDSDKLWSDRIPPDILGSIASRLVVGEYFVFRVVCKQWRLAPLMPPSHRPRRLHDDLQLPYLMTLHEKTGIVEFFDPVYNVVTTHNPGSNLKTDSLFSMRNGCMVGKPKGFAGGIAVGEDLRLCRDCWTFSVGEKEGDWRKKDGAAAWRRGWPSPSIAALFAGGGREGRGWPSEQQLDSPGVKAGGVYGGEGRGDGEECSPEIATW
ncbi:hypothetical protein T459_22500 [Capsicum annuum]|uniref:F-box domain-containing protein n=1 Tax=Capsicum annuum TaxID=4072 RepID=A0A2G2YPX1_CAPAN|nr:hypothetical protein T459_22500 [Capsicum annuum]